MRKHCHRRSTVVTQETAQMLNWADFTSLDSSAGFSPTVETVLSHPPYKLGPFHRSVKYTCKRRISMKTKASKRAAFNAVLIPRVALHPSRHLFRHPLHPFSHTSSCRARHILITIEPIFRPCGGSNTPYTKRLP